MSDPDGNHGDIRITRGAGPPWIASPLREGRKPALHPPRAVCYSRAKVIGFHKAKTPQAWQLRGLLGPIDKSGRVGQSLVYSKQE